MTTSTPAAITPRISGFASVAQTEPSPLSRRQRFSAGVAASLALSGLAATLAMPDAVRDVGAMLGAAAGGCLALALGASASDRRGRRRFTSIGLTVATAGAMVPLVGAPTLPAGLLLGIGAMMTVVAATAWLADTEERTGTSLAVALVAMAAGVAVGALLAPLVVAGLAVAALAATAVAAETVRGPRTPVYAMPAAPQLVGPPAARAVLLALVVILALPRVGLAATLVAATVLAVGARLAGFVRRRPRSGSEPGARHTRAYRRAVASFDSTASPAPARGGTVTTVEEVRRAIGHARAAQLGVSMHSTGHAAMGLGDLRRNVLVKVAMDGPITVDPAGALVRVPAGRPWADVVPLLRPHGLAVPHGSSGHVGVVGYLTRGGLSAYGRHTGVAANHLESIELVTADGEHLTVSRVRDPELFWALRGGGGGFGVVTAVTVRAFTPGTVVTGTTAWELDDAREVARAWAEWTAGAPSAITTSLRILSLAPLPGMPLRLTGRPLLVVDGTAVDGDACAREAAGELLARLRGAGRPVLDTWRVADPGEVPHTHMDPPIAPAHGSRHALVGARGPGDLSQAIQITEAMLAGAARPNSRLAFAELRQLGGALASPVDDGGAVGHYRGAFGWLAIALHGRRGAAAAREAIDTAWEPVSRWATGYSAPTLAVERENPERSFPADTALRVAQVRSRVDPDGVFATDVQPAALPR
ncbi:FAD-binding oxidoreductase [Pengzhenrongella sicca]|uniref:FAD-binding oxidoreductase n=1 Tax=Pengzhenrongella sicca TaxID=2819238 RepID=A0A8A4ZA65_9MICO|nr:FAD-binding protein [Pengzhenrongella sicca]QTE28840.1 FAD-binding oxidoreductase [Pengzhenrongella sicca]